MLQIVKRANIFNDVVVLAANVYYINGTSTNNQRKTKMNTYTLLNKIQDLGFDRYEAIEIARNDDDDFYSPCNNWRFIREDEIDRVQQEELSSDAYMLGCFNASFIANILDTDEDAIKAMQDANAYEGIGKMLLKHIDEIQQQYSSMDGYGHHFAHYDHNEHELGEYLAFRVN